MSIDLYRPSPAPTTQLEVSSAPDSDNVLGTIAICVRDEIKTATMVSLLHSNLKYFAPRGVQRLFIQGSILTIQRNEAIERMRGDWILFIDDDMTWEPDAISRLVAKRDELDLDVVGGLCFRRTYPHQPTMYHKREGPTDLYVTMEQWEENALVRVDATGCAFLLVTVRALERIAGGPMPPYEMRVNGSPPPNFFRWEGIKGEDIRFCEDLVAAGNEIYVDTSIKIGHLGEKEITERDFYQAIAERDPQTTKAVRKMYRKRGLPIMNSREAKRKLHG